MRSSIFWKSGVAVVAIAVAAPAYAQASEDDSAGETIVVTARKRAENLIDVPLAVSVTTKAQLERDQINTLNDLQRTTPALEISQTAGGESNGGARLRGLGTGVFNPSVASSVAYVIDQVPMGNMSFPQLFDIGQVEVLRGPQGTLFGQGASAGVINVSTRAPSTDEFGVNGSVHFADKGTAGSEVGELIVNAGLNLPVSDSAAFRVATQYRKETGLQRSTTTGDNKIKDVGVRVRALLKPSETVTVNLSAEYAKETSDGQTFFSIAIAPNRTNLFTPPGPPGTPALGPIGVVSTASFSNPACNLPEINPRAEFYCEGTPSKLGLSIGGVSAVFDVELSDNLTFTSVSGYRERSFKQFTRDFSRVSQLAAARQERTQEDSRTFSQELRLTYDGDALDLVVGGYYGDYFFDRKPIGTGPFTYGNNLLGQRIGFSVCPASGLGFCPVQTNFTKETTENRNLAVFADATFAVTDALNIFGGLRYSDYRNSTDVTVFRATSTTVQPTFVTKDGDLSGRIGVSFKPNATTNIYGSYSRGYKPPAVGTTAAGSLFNLKPEKADAFELGAKFGVGRFNVSGNIFYSKIDNFQAQTSVFVGTALISVPLNIPSVKSKGFEVAVFGNLFKGLSVNAGYQFNDAKYPAGYLGDDGLSIGGRQLIFAPKHKATLSTEYAAQVGDKVEVFANAGLVYKGATLLGAYADPRFVFPSHATINLGLGVREPDSRWSASLFVRNLTKQREPTAYLAHTFFGQPDGGIRAWPIAGITARVVGMKVGFDF